MDSRSSVVRALLAVVTLLLALGMGSYVQVKPVAAGITPTPTPTATPTATPTSTPTAVPPTETPPPPPPQPEPTPLPTEMPTPTPAPFLPEAGAAHPSPTPLFALIGGVALLLLLLVGLAQRAWRRR